MTDFYKNNYRSNQMQIYRLFPEDLHPTLIVYTQLIESIEKPIIKYPKYSIWERIVIMPLKNFDERLKSLRDLVTDVEKNTEKIREKEIIGYDSIDDANSENYVDLNNLSPEEISKMRDDL